MKKGKGKESGALSVWRSKAGKSKGIRKSTEHGLVKGALANVAALRNMKHDAADAPAEREQVLGLLEAELHLLVPGVRGKPASLPVATVQPKVEKKVLSQRTAAKELGIGRPALTALINSKQVAVVVVNGVKKIPQAEVQRLATSGWDVDAPIPVKKPSPLSRNGSMDAASVKDAILKLKI